MGGGERGRPAGSAGEPQDTQQDKRAGSGWSPISVEVGTENRDRDRED